MRRKKISFSVARGGLLYLATKYAMNQIRNSASLIVITLLTISNSFCQSSDDKVAIQKALTTALLDISSPRQLSTIDYSLSVITVSFDRKGHVEQIKTTNLPTLFDSTKLEKQIKERIFNLSLNTRKYQNQGIVGLVLILKKDKNFSSEELSQKWLACFTKTDDLPLEGKKLKYIIPVVLNIYGSIN